eukprot:3760059-Amphidinium_carterae.1
MRSIGCPKGTMARASLWQHEGLIWKHHTYTRTAKSSNCTEPLSPVPAVADNGDHDGGDASDDYGNP